MKCDAKLRVRFGEWNQPSTYQSFDRSVQSPSLTRPVERNALIARLPHVAQEIQAAAPLPASDARTASSYTGRPSSINKLLTSTSPHLTSSSLVTFVCTAALPTKNIGTNLVKHGTRDKRQTCCSVSASRCGARPSKATPESQWQSQSQSGAF